MSNERTTAKKRGFAAMSPERQREIAAKGGANVPKESRSFSKNRALAVTAGHKGGKSVAPEQRSFTKNRQLASEAGRKGGTIPKERGRPKSSK